MALAGLDVGTSGCKFTVYSDDGTRLLTARRAYEEFSTGPGRRELDPAVVLQNALEAVAEGCRLSPEPVEAFAVTSMGETTIVVDEAGNSLMHAMVTGDARGIAEAKRLVEMVPKGEIMDITGVPASEMYSLPKWMWINEQTDVFQKGSYVFLFEDYVAWTLTGLRKVSYSSAARTMAFDVEKKAWSEKLLAVAGLTPAMMSTPVPPGEIVGEVRAAAARRYGLPEGLVVVAGGHDQNMATLGAGVDRPSMAEDGIGTCEVLAAMLPKAMKTPYMMENDFVCIPYAYPDTYLTYIVMPTVGILMNWTRDNFFSHLDDTCRREGKNTLAAMDAMLGDVPSGLLVLPQFGSAGIPDVDYGAKGLIWGLTVHTKPIEVYRAVLESMSYHMLMAYQMLAPLGVKNDLLRLTGGGSNSKPMLQMRADVFGLPVQQMENTECGTVGCMLLAGKALGKFGSLDAAIAKAVRVGQTFQPDARRHDAYLREYEKYQKLYKMMHNFKG